MNENKGFGKAGMVLRKNEFDSMEGGICINLKPKRTTILKKKALKFVDEGVSSG
jgi:hypothetical protein